MNNDVVVFGGGCFWCTEALFKSLKGVLSVTPGYSGGSKETATYEKVCAGNTGHAEVVRIEYDPSVISFSDLLAVFFNTHDPTTPNRQGGDVGEQYRSIIFYTSDKQRVEAEALIDELNEKKAYDSKVVTKVEQLKEFFAAEDYHKDYYAHNTNAPYCELVIAPKLEKLNKKFAELIK